jgi:SAM-dependent methyltransferase
MDSKERFSNRVDMYVKYRPSYSKEAIDYLYTSVGLSSDADAADVGAGTGIFSKLLLERGTCVTAVEPNAAMREAAAERLGEYPNFRTVTGSAEETGLPERSVDFIVCAQAFHWFDRAASQAEFRRILRPGGKVVLIWNSRLTHGTPFLEQYEQLLRTYGTDYNEVNHKNISMEMLETFFQDGGLHEARFHNRQVLDFDGLKGRLMSSSYCPVPGHPSHEPLMAELKQLFDRSQQGGTVSLDYEIEIYWGEV